MADKQIERSMTGRQKRIAELNGRFNHSVDDIEAVLPDLDDMTIALIREELRIRGIHFTTRMTKKKLLELF